MPKYHIEFVRTEQYRDTRDIEAVDDAAAIREAERFLGEIDFTDCEISDAVDVVESITRESTNLIDSIDIYPADSDEEETRQITISDLLYRRSTVPQSPEVVENNELLKASMFGNGFWLVTTTSEEFFANKSGVRRPFPTGYIRGPFYSRGNFPNIWRYLIVADALSLIHI